ncbi:MAG TPA: DUF6797 domain-containing protein [Tepidisphaeraceae bacterium]|jgi:hypothetical protein|nr:DUF6797 domain-containing protein [Tepidisphaeraceae bacterium]
MTKPHLKSAFALIFLALTALSIRPALAGKDDRTRPADKEALAMDYGPCIANTFEAPNGNLTVKGILIKLDKEHDANVLFDTELCRWSCGWVGPNLHLASRVFSSDNDFHCTIENGVQFATGMTPGWANGEKYDDPRQPKDGPLPHEWAHYKGLYQHGNQVVVSYSVGKTDVLELPGGKFGKLDSTFTRDLRVGPHDKPLSLLVCRTESDPGAQYSVKLVGKDDLTIGLPNKSGITAVHVDGKLPGAKLSSHGPDTYLDLPPATAPTIFRIVIGNMSKAIGQGTAGLGPVAQEPVDPEPLTHGGPAKWAQTITTQGKLAADDKAPYVIDDLPAPDKNPWNSWIRFTGIDFFPDGHRAALCTWSGDVWIVSGIDHDLKELQWKRFATGLNNPMGVKIVDGVVYTIDRSQITKLVDLNNDGEADFYENFNNDCTLTPNFHEMAFDLQTDSQGNFYFSKSSAIWAPPLRLAEDAGCVLKVSKDGSKLEKLCYGLRAPNGVSVGPDDKVYCTDNQGNWVPACPINLIKKDAFYGYAFHEGRPNPPDEREKPLCWIPYGKDKSSGTLAWDLGEKWGPFKNHMIECSYDCSIFEVIAEFVGDQVQGGVVKFPLHFPSGVMRARFSPADGQLYLAGMRGWSSRAVKDDCLQRVRYTGKPANYPMAVKTVHDGMEVTFSNPLDAKSVEVDNIAAEQFNVVRTANYGSPEFSVKDPKKAGHDEVTIKSAKLLADGKTVALEIPGLKSVTNFNLTFKLTAADGTAVDQELDYTINRVP